MLTLKGAFFGSEPHILYWRSRDDGTFKGQRNPAPTLPICFYPWLRLTDAFSREDPDRGAVTVVTGAVCRQHVVQSSGRELCSGLIVQNCRGTMEESYRKGSDVIGWPPPPSSVTKSDLSHCKFTAANPWWKISIHNVQIKVSWIHISHSLYVVVLHFTP